MVSISPVAVLTSIVRPEEKAIFNALQSAQIAFDHIDLRSCVFPLHGEARNYPVVLNRSISSIIGLQAVELFESSGTRCINTSHIISMTGNKASTAALFEQSHIPCPRWRLALGVEAVMLAIQEIGFPVVLKPVGGSWGRQVVKLDDTNAVETAVEYRNAMPGSQNKIYFFQEYIEKPGRDIRVIVVGRDIVATYTRYSDHWKTNVKRGARSESIALTDDVRIIVDRVRRTLGKGFLSIDLIECPRRGILVNEVNHTPEFVGAMEATGADIAGALAAYTKRALS